MEFIDRYDFELLVNEAERLVLKELGRQLERLQDRDDICLCNECVVDMAAMALNAVKPLYRFSILGSLYAANMMHDEAFAKDLRQKVTNAIEKVSSNPGHDIPAKEE